MTHQSDGVTEKKKIRRNGKKKVADNTSRKEVKRKEKKAELRCIRGFPTCPGSSVRGCNTDANGQPRAKPGDTGNKRGVGCQSGVSELGLILK